MPDLKDILRSYNLRQIAKLIRLNWYNPYFGADPYINAMHGLDSLSDSFGYNSGRYLVAHFLANARSWRGPVAKTVKAELNRRLKSVR